MSLTDIILLSNQSEFETYIRNFGFIGIFVWFVTFNQLNPVPSEISLLIIGYFIANHVFNPVLAGVASIAGFLAIDVMYYYLSRTGNRLITRKKKSKPSSLLETYKKKLKEHMPRTLILIMFIPRIRMLGPILLGGMKASFRKFLLYDAIGVTLFTAVYLTLGYVFEESIESVFDKMEAVQHLIMIGALVLIGVVVIVVVSKWRLKKAH